MGFDILRVAGQREFRVSQGALVVALRGESGEAEIGRRIAVIQF